MQNKRKTDFIFLFSIVSYFIMSADFVLMSFSVFSEKAGIVFCGIVFWLFLILGSVFSFLFSKVCKKIYYANMPEKDIYKRQKIGLITFFSNIYAVFADVIMFLSVIAFIFIVIFTDKTEFICYLSVAVLVFSFIMHCILNGKSFCTYRMLKNT